MGRDLLRCGEIMNELDNLRDDLRRFKNPERAKALKWFFKTRKGEYGEGDDFLGLMTSEVRRVAKKYLDLSFVDISELLASKIHEERVAAVVILNQKFGKTDKEGKKEIFDFYFKNLGGINNWDLVDGSAPTIVGSYLYISGERRKILYELAQSDNLWRKRIAMMACLYFIKNKDFNDALQIAELLINDKHDLIQKVVGWMLREIGNRDVDVEEKFLKKHYKTMPRVCLRYAIEKFPWEKRQKYLKGRI